MSITRRSVLAGASLTGVAGLAIGNPTGALAQGILSRTGTASPPALLLFNATAAGQSFMDGARAAGGTQLQMLSVNHDLGFMLELERLMRSSRSLRLVGLLDDASATLVIDMARSAGVSMQWLGQHSVAGNVVRHRVLTAGPALNAATCEAALHETEASAWARSLGYWLGSSGAVPGSAVPLASAASAQVHGQFVSFSMDTAGSLTNG